jgi:hypothetical protein
MLINTEAKLVDALKLMHDEAVALKFTINGIVAYLKQIDANDDADEYETHAAYVGDAAADAAEFVQFIENRE